MPAPPNETLDDRREPSIPVLTLQILAIVLVMAGGLWTLYKIRSVLLLLVLSLFFAYLIAPIVSILRRPIVVGGRSRILPRPAAIAVTYVLVFGILAIAAWIVLPIVSAQFDQLAGEFPGYLAKIQTRIQTWQRFERTQFPKGMRDAINASFDGAIQAATTAIRESVLPFLGAVLGYLPWLVLVPIFALFLLKDSDVLRAAVLRMLPQGRARVRGRDFVQDVHETLAAYVRAQVVASVLIGLACAIGFAVIGVPYAVVLGVAAGILEFLPLVGPLTVAGLAVVITLFHSPSRAVPVLLFLAILRIVEDYVVYPRIIGRGIHLHPLAVIVAILCGAELAGLPGVFLSIPAVAVLSVAYRHWREHRAEESDLVGG